MCALLLRHHGERNSARRKGFGPAPSAYASAGRKRPPAKKSTCATCVLYVLGIPQGASPCERGTSRRRLSVSFRPVASQVFRNERPSHEIFGSERSRDRIFRSQRLRALSGRNVPAGVIGEGRVPVRSRDRIMPERTASTVLLCEVARSRSTRAAPAAKAGSIAA